MPLVFYDIISISKLWTQTATCDVVDLDSIVVFVFAFTKTYTIILYYSGGEHFLGHIPTFCNRVSNVSRLYVCKYTVYLYKIKFVVNHDYGFEKCSYMQYLRTFLCYLIFNRQLRTFPPTTSYFFYVVSNLPLDIFFLVSDVRFVCLNETRAALWLYPSMCSSSVLIWSRSSWKINFHNCICWIQHWNEPIFSLYRKYAWKLVPNFKKFVISNYYII